MVVILGGDHLLVDVDLGESLAGGERAPEALDLGNRLRGHGDAAPAAAGELEHGPDQAEGRRLAGERPITFVRRRTSTKVRSRRFVLRIRLRCSEGKRRCTTRASRSSASAAAKDG